jgi:pyrroloquinoline quinone biosynthesis protein B
VRIRVLGSAAGGGFPQWNCGCPNCRGVRLGTLAAQPRTQESVAISADGESWFLLNASPEIRTHIESFAPLAPRAPRDTPIAGLLLTNGDLDHCLGLLALRESQPLTVYATEQVWRGFTEGNVLYRTLERFPGQVRWQRLRPGESCELLAASDRPSGLVAEAIAVPGQPPLHLRSRSAPSVEDNVGFGVRELATGATCGYFSGVAGPTRALEAALASADCLFLDGTFWSSDELIALGLSDRRAEDMAHWPIGGAGGSLKSLAGKGKGRSRKIFIHINNTNPILREDSPERAALSAAGWEVAYDGLELEI